MPVQIPKLRRQSSSPHDRAFVVLNGVHGGRVYLGRWGTPEAKRAYAAALAEWIGNGNRLPVPPAELTIIELIAAFWAHAERHYRRPDGSAVRGSLDGYRIVLAILRRLYGPTPAALFGPLQLRAVREDMIQAGLSRGVVNQRTHLLRGVFRWGVGQSMLPPHVLAGLAAVEALRRGRTDAPDHDPIKPVPEAHVDAIRPHVSRQVWGLVQLALLTGARMGELVLMRPIDLDTSGKVWGYAPSDHKTAYRGHARMIHLGPRAQEVVKPFLTGRPVDAPLFSPAEAEHERLTARHKARRTPLSCGNTPGSNREHRPDRKAGAIYTVNTVRTAIKRACRKADVPEWNPHQLRHNAATNLRRDFGIELARAALGHRSLAPTMIYAEADARRVADAVLKVG